MTKRALLAVLLASAAIGPSWYLRPKKAETPSLKDFIEADRRRQTVVMPLIRSDRPLTEEARAVIRADFQWLSGAIAQQRSHGFLHSPSHPEDEN